MRLLTTAVLAMALSAPAPALATTDPAPQPLLVTSRHASSSAVVTALPSYRLVTLGVLPGDEFSLPHAINGTGEVVGYSGGVYEVPRPFRWSAATGIQPLYLPAGALSGVARDINSRGDVTGQVEQADHRKVAVRWTPTGRLVRLGAFGPDASSFGFGINGSPLDRRSRHRDARPEQHQ
jgi:uncharacterized membrane protein